MMEENTGVGASSGEDQALVSDQAAAHLAPPGFDPSRKAGDWCFSCNVPLGVGACNSCRVFSWQSISARNAPPHTAEPDANMFAMALSVGMGAASEIVRRRWGQRYAQCIDDYVADFDRKRASGIEAAAAGETGTGSTVGESPVGKAETP